MTLRHGLQEIVLCMLGLYHYDSFVIIVLSFTCTTSKFCADWQRVGQFSGSLMLMMLYKEPFTFS